MSESKPRKKRVSVTAELFEAVCQRLERGETLRGICQGEEMPDPSAIVAHCNVNTEAFQRYARARNTGYDALAEQIIEIADVCREGVIRKTSEKDGTTVEIRDMVERAKLQVDSRKWLLSRLRPDKYGDISNLRLSGPSGGAIESKSEVTIRLVRPTQAGAGGES